ncbi:hypothetical protein [Agromyces humatus]|uniref:Uncharacterized protein n=1 Tax=Agromyces humatus TaxID=279573 RepID=A0ABN2KX52_9MICO|nr:hypothetical protein [Agromyces humatus]
MSAERIDCPVPWCEGDARGHRPRNEHDFHMSADTVGPLNLTAALTRVDDEPVKLAINAEHWASEATVDDARKLASEAAAAASWLLEQAVALAALNREQGS